MNRKHNFAAGPAALPLEVINQATNAVKAFRASDLDPSLRTEFDEFGFSILELNHRSEAFYRIRDELKLRLRAFLNCPDTHEICFMQGGGRHQFAMVPFNFSSAQRSGLYIETGHWGSAAIAEAGGLASNVSVLWSDRAQGYRHVPKVSELKAALDLQQKVTPSSSIIAEGRLGYIHLTSNETIQGVQLDLDSAASSLKEISPGVPIIVDASSDFCSMPIDLSNISLLYACAQKTMGIPGNTVVIASKNFLSQENKNLPPMWSYSNHFKEDSIYNTSAVFPIYVTLLMVRWMETKFKTLDSVATFSTQKYEVIMNVVSRYPELFQLHAEHGSDSRMNIVLKMPSEDIQKKFISEAANANIIGIAGHRALGGIRISNYPAVTLESIEVLAKCMTKFAQNAT